MTRGIVEMSFFGGLWAGAKMVLGLGTGGGTSTNGTDNVMTIAKGVGGFIDEQNFTAEEKAVYNANMVKSMNGFVEGTVNENTQRSITRRDVAILVMRWALLMLTISAVMWKFDTAWAEYIRNLVIKDPMGYFLLGIGAFFFGAHIIRSMKTGK